MGREGGLLHLISARAVAVAAVVGIAREIFYLQLPLCIHSAYAQYTHSEQVVEALSSSNKKKDAPPLLFQFPMRQ